MRFLRLAGLACLFVLSAAAHPSIITTSPNTYLFNFDFTAASPSPPYQVVTFQPGLVLASFGLGDICNYRYFNELDAQSPLAAIPTGCDPPFAATFTLPGFVDGLFSVTLEMGGGSIEIDPTAIATSATGQQVTLPPVSVPEPVPLALLGLGALLLGFVHRARRSQS